MKKLVSGEKIKVMDYIKGREFQVRVEIDSAADFDFACFGLNEQKKISNHSYILLDSHTVFPDKSVQVIKKDSRHAIFTIQLDKLSGFIHNLQFLAAASVEGGLADVKSGKLSIVQNGQELLYYHFEGSDFNQEKTLILFELYKKETYRISIVGNGFNDGLNEYLKRMGGDRRVLESIKTATATYNRNLNLQSSSTRHTAPKTGGMKLRYFALLGLILGIILFFIINAVGSSDKSYLQELKVTDAEIVSKSADENGEYIKCSLGTDISKPYVKSDNLYVYVNPQFFLKHNPKDKIGVLLGRYDIYRHKALKKGNKLIRSEWTIDNVYDSFEIAMEANQVKKFKAASVITEKKTLEDGKQILILDYNNITFAAEVNDTIFNKYSVSQRVECEFESMGDLTKLMNVLG